MSSAFKRPSGRTAVAFLLGLALAGPASAQQPIAGCTLTDLPDPPRRVLQCQRGLRITAEAGTAFGLRASRGQVRGVTVNGRGVLVDTGGPRSEPFQVLTPHAVASVRGTRFAVDVTEAMTSVFVQRGAVGVRRRTGGRGVLLGAGDGVDVTAGRGPLEVKRWSAERASRLLARFGE